jgi:hypothetical protein
MLAGQQYAVERRSREARHRRQIEMGPVDAKWQPGIPPNSAATPANRWMD